MSSVRHTRWKLGIHYANPERRPWSKAEERLLGNISDRETTQRTGRTIEAVLARRVALGRRDPTRRRAWTAAEDRLLGTASDGDIAHLLKRTVSAVKTRRKGLKIPAARPV